MTAPSATVARCSSAAPKPAAPIPARRTSPIASFAPSESAPKYVNAPCSIWDDTLRSSNTTGRPFADGSTRPSPASSNSATTRPGRWKPTPSVSPPNCSRAATPPTMGPISNEWTSIRWSSCAHARSAWSTWGCGRWTSSHFAPGSRSWGCPGRCARRPSARSSPAWPVRARNARRGAGSANEAPLASCWGWISRPWGRCSCIAPRTR